MSGPLSVYPVCQPPFLKFFGGRFCRRLVPPDTKSIARKTKPNENDLDFWPHAPPKGGQKFIFSATGACAVSMFAHRRKLTRMCIECAWSRPASWAVCFADSLRRGPCLYACVTNCSPEINIGPNDYSPKRNAAQIKTGKHFTDERDEHGRRVACWPYGVTRVGVAPGGEGWAVARGDDPQTGALGHHHAGGRCTWGGRRVGSGAG